MNAINLQTLKSELNKKSEGLLFCFGTSVTSQLIRLRTQETEGELVPSHVAMIYNGYVYESTTADVKVGSKRIPGGVRRWMLKDFFKAEKTKDTTYIYIPYALNLKELERYIFYPYGVDTIVDYFFTNKSNGKSKGLICSQYANRVIKLFPFDCCTPAQMFRKVIQDINELCGG